MEILVSEVAESYAAIFEGCGIERDVLQYADLAEWLRQLLDSEEGRGFTVPVGGETEAGGFMVGVEQVTDTEVIVRVRA